MAAITIPDENRRIDDPKAISEFLAPFGIFYERWNVNGRIDRDASPEEILDAYAPEVEKLKTQGGYVTADVINCTPETPGLDEMLNRFNKEHRHTEDEVRFVVKGSGVFHINPDDAPVFAIHVESGDLINVPAGTRHWFDLCDDKTIRCIRLFQEKAGWTPHYVEGGVHEGYTPVCWGPTDIPVQDYKPSVKI